MRKTLEGKRQGKVDNLSNASDCGVTREESVAQGQMGRNAEQKALSKRLTLWKPRAQNVSYARAG